MKQDIIFYSFCPEEKTTKQHADDIKKLLRQELKTIIKKTLDPKSLEDKSNGRYNREMELIQSYKDMGYGDILKELNIK